MVNINKDNLEKVFDTPPPSRSGGKGTSKQDVPKVSKEQEIGHHQGALSTLVNERNELFKMIQNVEMVMQVHIKRLEELGVKIQAQEQKK